VRGLGITQGFFLRCAYLALKSAAGWLEGLFAIIAVPSWQKVIAWHQPMSGITDWSTIARTRTHALRFVIR
jgi:hypothetical protein